MSKPSFSNIDLWLFELSEGNLNPEQVEELRIFLLKHPDLDIDRDVWEMAKVQPVIDSKFPNSSMLEKKEPKRVYYAFGSLAVILLLFFGCYQYYGEIQSNEKFVSVGTKKIKPASQNSLNANQASLLSSRDFRLTKTIKSGFNIPSNERNFLESKAVQSIMTPMFSPITFFEDNENIGIRNKLLGINQVSLVKDIVKNLRRKEFEKLKMHPTELIYEKDYNGSRWLEKQTLNLPAVVSSSKYNETFRMKVKRTMKNLERMFDNPIALKNYRDPNYHVPGKMANEINFSSTGTMLRTRVQTLSRMQWYGEENELLMNTVSIDGYIYGMRGGMGMQIKNSIYNGGGLNAYEAAFTYSPKLSVNSFVSIEPSLRFKMGMKTLNKNRMHNVNSIEIDRGNLIAYETPYGTNLWYRDLGLGLMLNTKWFFLGAQLDNVFGHEDNMYGGGISDPREAGKEFIATAGVDWESRKENMMLSPYLVYMNKEQISDLWIGANYRFNWFTVGAAISDKVEPTASIGIKFERFSLVYNADYLKSSLTNKQSLSHQVSVRIMSKPKKYGYKLLNL
ncbi:MAG: type IX secretion system membrane protein PorP/SprF [Crocinitomicaceae bacterium]